MTCTIGQYICVAVVSVPGLSSLVVAALIARELGR